MIAKILLLLIVLAWAWVLLKPIQDTGNVIGFILLPATIIIGIPCLMRVVASLFKKQ